jgi:hypothetical protein
MAITIDNAVIRIDKIRSDYDKGMLRDEAIMEIKTVLLNRGKMITTECAEDFLDFGAFCGREI